MIHADLILAGFCGFLLRYFFLFVRRNRTWNLFQFICSNSILVKIKETLNSSFSPFTNSFLLVKTGFAYRNLTLKLGSRRRILYMDGRV